MRNSLYIILGSIITLSLPVNAAEYEEISVKNGGTITGKVTFNGSEAEAEEHSRVYTITKQTNVCGTGSRKVEYVKLNGKALNDVVVYLDKVKRGKAWGEKNATINQQNCEFLPFFTVMGNKGELTSLNSDPVAHNIHTYAIIGRARKTQFNLTQAAQGSKVSKEIALKRRSNGMKVECDQHDFMHSFVFVAKNPYYAVVAQDGTFKIEDIPPGNYKLKAWHGYLKNPRAKRITVEADETEMVDFEYENKRK